MTPARLPRIAQLSWLWLPLGLAVPLPLLYGPLLTGARILVDYDLYTYFYPYHEYVASALRSGRLPLWNPYLFAGVPLLANVQTAIFYPLNWPGFLLPAPAAIGMTIAVHVFLAALFTYAFARGAVGLGRGGAFLAALAFAYGGFLNQQVGHPNQLSASAWLPLALLLFDRACRRRTPAAVALAAVAIGIQALAGHPQETYLTLVALGVWAISLALRRGEVETRGRGEAETRGRGDTETRGCGDTETPGRGEGRTGSASPCLRVSVSPLLLLVAVAALGLGLAAVQYAPTAELSARSIRSGGLTLAEAGSFSLPPSEVLRALLPTFGDPPFAEYIGYVGVVALLLAALAVVVRPRDRRVLTLGILAAGALVLAFGRHNPVYPWLLEGVPGLDLFRVPARWLFLTSFALAVLGGFGLDLLTQNSTVSRRHVARLTAAFAFASAVAIAVMALRGLPFPPSPAPFAWAGLGVITLLAIGLGGAETGRRGDGETRGRFGLPRVPESPRLRVALTFLLAAAELTIAGGTLGIHHPTDPGVYDDVPPGVARILADEGHFRVLSLASSHYEVGDRLALEPRLRERGLSDAEVVDYLVASKHQATLTPNISLRYPIATLDGYDGGVLPLKAYVQLKPLLAPPPGGVPPVELDRPDAILRAQLRDVPETRLLGLLNVKYLIADRLSDGWVSPGPVYYDLLAGRRAAPGRPVVVESLPDFPATAVGLATGLLGAAGIPDGAPVARVTVFAADGRSTAAELRAGINTAESRYEMSRPAHRQPRPLAGLQKLSDSYVYESRVAVPGPMPIRRVQVDYLGTGGELEIRGLTLLDAQTLANASVTLHDRLRLVELGDLKVYENLDVLPRAFVAYRTAAATTPLETVALLRADPGRLVLAEQPPDATSTRSPEGAEVLVAEPERVVVRARLAESGWLVLTDADYPGWVAEEMGRVLPIERANLLFRAVRLAAGEHVVEFRYEPTSLRLGALITGLSLIGLLGLAIWGLGRAAPPLPLGEK